MGQHRARPDRAVALARLLDGGAGRVDGAPCPSRRGSADTAVRREPKETALDKARRIEVLVDHFRNPRHYGAIEAADVAMPGGSPECGGSVVVYLKGDGNGGISNLSFTGQGDTISQGATSMVLEMVRDGGLGMDEVLALDYEGFVDGVGREVVGSRTRNATLGLSTLKSAVRRYLRDRRSAG